MEHSKLGLYISSAGMSMLSPWRVSRARLGMVHSWLFDFSGACLGLNPGKVHEDVFLVCQCPRRGQDPGPAVAHLLA